MLGQHSSSFSVTALDDELSFGALVTDLDPDAFAYDAVCRELYELWIERGVLVFRGLPDEPEIQIALSRIFGEPDVHPFKKLSGQGNVQELTDVFYRPDRGDIVRLADGRRLGAWLPWHFDLMYVEQINHGGILRPVDMPDEGGRTGFIDGRDAYERLPRSLKHEIADLWVVYQFDGDLAALRHGRTADLELERMNVGSREVMDNLDRYPPVAHPLVFRQPETGREVLNFSPWFALGIEGLDQTRSDRILDAVANHLIDDSRAYFHRWQKGDMVLWDNWRIVHCATGIPADQSRHMQRTTIRGDYGLGRPANWP